MLPDCNLLLSMVQDRDNRELFLQLLKEIVRAPQLLSSFQQNEPAHIDNNDSRLQEYRAFSLIDDTGFCQYRVNAIGDYVFVTDGPWNVRKGGIFPFADESDLILTHARKEASSGAFAGFLDIGTGCGHVAVAVPFKKKRVGVDMNPRARAFVQLNAIINGCQVEFFNWNIDDGLMEVIDDRIKAPLLVTVNLPHAISPNPQALPSTSDGGETGLRWTLAALHALKELIEGTGSRALILSYSLADSSLSRWDIVERAVTIFDKAKVTWHFLSESRIWRINGVKLFNNPSPLYDVLPKKADCKLYVQDNERDAIRRGYYELVRRFESNGWTHLGYGLLQVDL